MVLKFILLSSVLALLVNSCLFIYLFQQKTIDEKFNIAFFPFLAIILYSCLNDILIYFVNIKIGSLNIFQGIYRNCFPTFCFIVIVNYLNKNQLVKKSLYFYGLIFSAISVFFWGNKIFTALNFGIYSIICLTLGFYHLFKTSDKTEDNFFKYLTIWLGFILMTHYIIYSYTNIQLIKQNQLFFNTIGYLSIFIHTFFRFFPTIYIYVIRKQPS